MLFVVELSHGLVDIVITVHNDYGTTFVSRFHDDIIIFL